MTNLGICLPHYGKAMEPAGLREFAQTAEELGFDSLWVTDHLIVPKARDMLYKENMLEALSTLNYLAGVTSRIRIGTSVIVLPYRHPVHVAKSIATADQLSGGRVTLGVGVGALEGEFRALKANFEERGAVADEYLRVIRSVWTDPSAGFEGDYVSFQDMFFSPPAVQQPHPPIWVGGSTRRAGRRAVELGDAWHGTNVTVEMFEDISGYMWRLSERQLRPMPGVNVRMPVYFDQPMPEGRIGLNGGDAEVAAQAKGYIYAGAEEVVFGLIDMPFTDAMSQLHRLSTAVAPRLR
jgi:probable F420-dependent oxidoreductase